MDDFEVCIFCFLGQILIMSTILAIRNCTKRTANAAFDSVRQAFAGVRKSINLQILKYTNARERLRTLVNTCERSVRRSFCAVTNGQNSTSITLTINSTIKLFKNYKEKLKSYFLKNKIYFEFKN
jgi:hypothetical protein